MAVNLAGIWPDWLVNGYDKDSVCRPSRNACGWRIVVEQNLARVLVGGWLAGVRTGEWNNDLQRR
jgi:hypothetical protein